MPRNEFVFNAYELAFSSFVFVQLSFEILFKKYISFLTTKTFSSIPYSSSTFKMYNESYKIKIFCIACWIYSSKKEEKRKKKTIAWYFAFKKNSFKISILYTNVR